MRINRIKWNNHPILGDLELDFINSATAKPFDNIVFAGENGTGKTSILETVSTFLNIGSFRHFDFIDYVADGRSIRAVQAAHNPSGHENFFDISIDGGAPNQIRTDRSNNRELIESNRDDIRHYGCVFSKARADYKTRQITHTSVSVLDTDKYDKDEEDDFTSLKQLIVDVDSQDNAAYAELNRALGPVPKSWDEFYPTSNIFRFKNAFDNFFGDLKYVKVIDQENEKAIIFEKNGKSISIDRLSTGEKQIVFRGIYLLRNHEKVSGAAILIDEPELSMHPKWQKNVLRYYKDLFVDGGVQTAQIFLATHSEYVVEEALANSTTDLVIVLKEVAGIIHAKRVDAPSVLPSITSAETNYLAFDVVSNDYHIELYGHLQQKESRTTVKSCDDFIKGHALYDPSLHLKPSSHGHTNYESLSTYIRNAIDHPDPARIFTEAELRTSTELLIELCK